MLKPPFSNKFIIFHPDKTLFFFIYRNISIHITCLIHRNQRLIRIFLNKQASMFITQDPRSTFFFCHNLINLVRLRP